MLDATGDGSSSDGLGSEVVDRSLHERFNHSGLAMTVTHLTRLEGQDGRSLVVLTLHAENTSFGPASVTEFRLRTTDGLHAARYQPINAASGDVLVRCRLLFDVPEAAATAAALETASLVVGSAGADRAVVPLGERPAGPVDLIDRHPVAVGFPSLQMPFRSGSTTGIGGTGAPGAPGAPGATGSGQVLVDRVEVGASVSNPEPAAEGMVWVGVAYEVCVDGPPITVDPVLVLPRGRRLREQVHLLQALSATPKCPVTPQCPTSGIDPTRRVGVAYWQVPDEISGTTPTLELHGADGVVLTSFPLQLPKVPEPSLENQLPRPRR